MRQDSLLEREHELGTLSELVEHSLEGDGRLALIEGPAGIGKSRLLNEVQRLADENGATVLGARGGELEVEFPFGIVRQLFEPILADEEARSIALSGAGAGAAKVFESTDEDSTGDAASFATLHGLYWLTLNLASDRPLVVKIDDLHWCDRSSLRFLAYLVRRIEGTPLLVAATLRTSEPGVDPNMLAEIANDPLAVPVTPGPLSERAVAEVVTERLGGAAEGRFAAACHAATGGNPLLLRELLTALRAEGVAPHAGQVEQVGEIGPRAVSRSVLMRLSRMGESDVRVARTVAVLGAAASVATVAAMTGLSEAQVAEATGSLVRADLLRPESPLGFVHPLIRDTVYRELSPGERELEHSRAAGILWEMGASSEQIATHLLLTEPKGDPEVARTLQLAGRSASHKGAADSATAYLRRALAEPPPPEHAPRLEFELGLAEALSSGARGIEHLERAIPGLQDAGSRAVAIHMLVRMKLFTGDQAGAAEMARRAAAELPPEMEEVAKTFKAFEWVSRYFDPSGDDSGRTDHLFREEMPGPGLGDKMLAAGAALDITYKCYDPERAVALSRAALDGGELISADGGFVAISACIALIFSDLDDAVVELEKARSEAHAHGSLFAISGINMWYGFCLYWRGELPEAEEQLRSAYDQLTSWGFGEVAELYLVGFLAITLIERGNLAEARTLLNRYRHEPNGSDGSRFWLSAQMALLLAEDRDEEAIEAAELFARIHPRIVIPAAARWRSAKAVALDRLGRTEEAVRLVEEELELARRWGAPGTVGYSLRILGQLKRQEGREHLEEAVRILEGSTARLDLAKSLLALGTRLRLGRRPAEAREPLKRALEIATVCDAEPVVRAARSELQAAGVRPRREALTGVAALTPSELRVVQHAADGLTNREIAQALFVTPKTVEVHLSNSYRKLEIRSRRELAGVIAP